MVIPPNAAIFAVMPDRRMTPEMRLLLQSYLEEINRLSGVVDALPAAALPAEYAGIYFTTPASTTIGVSGDYVKAAGTTTQTNISANMDGGSANNRLAYNGAISRLFCVDVFASVVMTAGANQSVGIAVYKFDASASSGSIVAHSEIRNTVPGSDIVSISSKADVIMGPGDYLEMHIANHTNTNAVRVDYGYMSCRSVSA